MKRVVLFALLAVCAVAVFSANAQTLGGNPADGLFEHHGRPAYFGKPIPATASFFSIDPRAFDRLVSTRRTTLVIPDFPINTAQRGTLRLDRFEVLAPGAQTLEGRLDGDRPATIEPGVFMKGTVEELPGSFVYLALFRTYCSGYIEIESAGRHTRFTIAPLELRDNRQSLMVIYDEPQALAMQGQGFLEQGQWDCGAEHVEGYQENVERVFKSSTRKKSAPRVQTNTLLAAQIATEGDSAFYVAHGRNLSRATNYILTVIGAMSAIYQRDLNVMMQVPFVRIWTGADPWPGANTSTLLPQFRTYWVNNMGGVQRTLAHMFSVSAVGGGIAYLNATCSSQWGYAVSGLNNNVTYPAATYVWDTDVTSHETGHNFGSPHTHSCSWAPAIDSCYTSEGGCFAGTNPRVGTIMSYCHLTAFGTLLNFHPRVAALMRTNAEAAACIGAFENSAANDVAVGSIEIPAAGGAIGTGVNFTPSAVFRNAGTNTQAGLSVNMTIRDSAGTTVYTNNQTIASLAPGASVSVNFGATSIATIGRYNTTVTITLAGDAFQANNTMVRPFEIVASVTRTVQVTAPNTAVTYRAGASTTINWVTTGGVTNVRIDFSPDDGATWFTVRSDVSAGAGSLGWVIPYFATTRGRVRVSDRDNAAVNDVNDQSFTINTLQLGWQWARRIGSVQDDDARDVATDNLGNVYAIGTFADSIWLDTAVLVSSGGTDGFIAKYTPGGSLLWARRFGGAGNDTGMAVAVDASNNVILTGGFSGTATIGATSLTSSGDADIIVAKFNAAGTLQWASRAGSIGRDQGRSLAVDNSNNIYVVGAFGANVSFGATTLSSSGLNDAFIARMAPAGTFDWAQRGGGADMDEANGVAVDAAGNSMMVGRYRTSATFGATTLGGNGGDDGFVVRYNTSGTFQWAASVVGTGSDEMRGVAIDGSGNALVTGWLTGAVNFGTTVNASVGARDGFVAKYSNAGTLLWRRVFGGSNDDWATAITLDAAGNSYVNGYFTTRMDIASITLSAQGGAGVDAFVAKFNPDGWPTWGIRSGGGRNEESHSIAINGNGDNGYMIGRYPYTPPADQPAIFGPDSLSGRGGNDIVLGRLGLFRVITPRERDQWRVGENRAITWSPLTATSVRIEISLDEGATWTNIVASAPNTGTYTWTVPATPAQRAMIRVSDASVPAFSGSAVSGMFEISTVLPPTGLIATGQNASVDLVWTPPVGPVVTAYAIYRATLPAAVPGSLALLTTVAGTQTGYADFAVSNCTDYVYAVKAIIGGTESVFSNLDTARPEAPRRLTPLGPLYDDKVPAGSTQPIRWTSSGCIDSVRLELWTMRGGAWTTMAVYPNTSTYSWSVPRIASTRAMIRIIGRSDTTVIGATDTFSICSATSSIVANGPTSFCEGDSVVLSAPEGYVAYLWSTGATTRTITVKNTGSYTVSVADSARCGATSEATLVTVNAFPRPRLSAQGATSLCEGDSVVLDAGAGFAGYFWSTGATTRRIVVKQPGRYHVRVSNEFGCANNSDTMSVQVAAKPQVSLTAVGPTRVCEGDSVVLDAGAGFSTYSWSNGATTRTIAVKQTGRFAVRVTNDGGCASTSDSMLVTVLAKPAKPIIARNTRGDSLAYNGVLGTLQWKRNDTVLTGVTGGTIKILATGTYIVTVIDSNGCTNTSEPFVVSELPSSVLAETGDRAFMFHPNPASGLVTIEAVVNGTGTLVATVTDLNGRTVLRYTGPQATGHVVRTIDIHALPSGVYFLEVQAGDRTWKRKLVKQ